MTKYQAFISRWGMGIAFLILAAAGMYAVNAQAESNAQVLYETQVESCRQANAVRDESNQRIAAHLIDRNVLSSFLGSAAEARSASGSAVDRKAASEYLDLRSSLARVQFQTQPLLDCEKAVPKP
jgi:hypothetical protein